MIGANDWYGFLGMGFGLVLCILIGAMLIVLMVQLFKSHQLKIQTAGEIARDQAYQKLSERSIAYQEELTQQLKKMEQELEEMRGHVASINQMMKEID